jgi:predicted phosphodiesterase
MIPPSLTHHDNWGIVEFRGPLRALILSDLHIPYHSTAALKIAIEHGIDRAANFILLNGDVADFFGLSSWEKDPTKRNLNREIQTGKAFLKELRDRFPKAKIVLKEGNHEERWQRYFQAKAPELLGIDNFTWPTVYELDSLKIKHIAERRPIKLGKLMAIHGHEYRFNISNPVNPARGLFLRGKTHAICGHFHQSSQHSEKRLDDKVIATWSTGCLCDLHPDYAPINNWNHGFAFAEITSNGTFQIENMRIIGGKAYL